MSHKRSGARSISSARLKETRGGEDGGGIFMRGDHFSIDLDSTGIQAGDSLSPRSAGTLHLRTYVSLHQLQLIADRISTASQVVGIATLNDEFQIVDANSGICELLGRPLPQLRGRKLQVWLDVNEGAHLSRELGMLIKKSIKLVIVDASLIKSSRARPIIRIMAFLGWTIEQHVGAVPRIIAMIRPHANADHRSRKSWALPLSDLDLKIIEGVAAGASTKHLSAELYLSKQGVEYHVSSMLRKLGVPNRAALVAKAYELDILDARCWPPRLRTTGLGQESGANSHQL